jgi:RNA polymerase sigma-70 factor (ECF subfamily)
VKEKNSHTLNVDSEFLIRQLKNGDESAYEMLFKEYYQLLVMFANKYLFDIEASKELVQDLFVHIYEKRENLIINSSLKSYLFRSVHNRSLNLINALKIKNKYVEHIERTTSANANSIENEMNKTELEHAIYKAIGELPPKCRDIFKLNRFEGLTNSEIAEKLKLSKRTVETQISKALKILRIKLEPYTAVSILFLLGNTIRLFTDLIV